MSKRNSKLKLPARSFKMPKLDISIEKPTTSKNINNNSNSAEKFKSAIPKKPAAIIDLLWDDDDEDLLFASQMVENNNLIPKNSTTIIETQSFSNFGRNVTSSTQIEQLPAAPDLFSDEDSCDFQIDQDLLNIINNNAFNKQTDNFQKPISPEKPTDTKINGINNNLMDEFNVPNVSSSTKQYNSRRNSTKCYDNVGNDAIQVNKLVERLDILNEESKKQNQQINQVNEKLSTKEGEVSVLRFEQRQLKQQIDTLRIQKITEADVIKKDWQDRIHELERNLNGKTIELNLKTNEIIKLKQLLFDGNRTVEISANTKSLAILYRLNCRNSSQLLSRKLRNSENQDLLVDIFKKSYHNYTFLDKYYQQQLNEICNVLAEIKFNPILLENSNTKQLIYNKILGCTAKGLNSLPNYFTSPLKQFKSVEVQNDSTMSKFENNQICYLHRNNTKMNICQSTELYQNEKMIPLRRYISALGLIYQKLTNVKLSQINTENTNNSNDCHKIVLEKLIELLKDSPDHFGVIESIAFLLSSLAKINNIKPYFNLLKNLIFCKPNIRTLAEISKCLLFISSSTNQQNLEVFNLLCQKSDGYLCLLNDTKKKIRVQRNTACILQIYGLILESAYKQNKSLNETEWKLLMLTCNNHMEFLSKCFEKHPHFLTTNTKCFCYIQVCTSFVILFHLFLKHCIENPINMKEQNVRRICKLGALLIFDIFYTNYRKSVLQKGGTGVKQRLYVICEWLNENFDNLGISQEYQIAIQRIRSSSIFADSILNNEVSQPICHEKGNIILRKIFDQNSFI